MEATNGARPRILLLSTAYLPLIGGSELAIHHIAQRLTDYDFDLVTGHYDSSAQLMETVGRVRVFRAGGRWARISLILPKLLLPLAIAVTALRQMRTHRYVAVHAYQVSQAAGAGFLIKMFRPRVPFIVTLQEGKDLQKQSWLTRTVRSVILKRANVVTAISEHLAAYARPLASSAIRIIPNGVDIRDISRIQNPDPTILTVSRLVRKNNVEAVLRAFAIVRRTVTNARLVVVGDGPLRKQLEALGAQLGIREFVHFTGSIPHEELTIMYSAADVFVRPSLSEGLGSVFLEAMATGAPVVTSNVGGITDIVRDGETGLFCNPKDPSDIAVAINKLLTDKNLRDHIVASASRFVQTYDWKLIAKQMEAVYESLAI